MAVFSRFFEVFLLDEWPEMQGPGPIESMHNQMNIIFLFARSPRA